MNKEVIKEWVNGLRSGEYSQGREALNVCGRYCCLGVLTDIAVKKGVLSEHKLSDLMSGMVAYGSEDETHILPTEVQEWAGLESGNPQINGSCIAYWNDFIGKSFNELADMIEEEYLSE